MPLSVQHGATAHAAERMGPTREARTVKLAIALFLLLLGLQLIVAVTQPTATETDAGPILAGGSPAVSELAEAAASTGRILPMSAEARLSDGDVPGVT